MGSGDIEGHEDIWRWLMPQPEAKPQEKSKPFMSAHLRQKKATAHKCNLKFPMGCRGGGGVRGWKVLIKILINSDFSQDLTSFLTMISGLSSTGGSQIDAPGKQCAMSTAAEPSDKGFYSTAFINGINSIFDTISKAQTQSPSHSKRWNTSIPLAADHAPAKPWSRSQR